MSIGKQVIKGTALLGIANIVMRFISFFTIILVVRDLTVFEYGVFTLFMSLTGPVHILSSLGMGELIVSDVSRSLGAKKLTRAKSILWYFFGFRFVLLIIVLSFAFIFRQWLEIKYGVAVNTYFWLFSILVVLQYLRNVYEIFFQIHETFKHLSLIRILESFVKFIAVAIFSFVFTLNIKTLIISYIFGIGFSIIIFTPTILKLLTYFKRISLEGVDLIYRIIRQHGKWQIGVNIASSVSNSIRYWLIKLIISTEATGIYALAQALYSALASLTPIKTVTFPVIAKHLDDKFLLQKLIQKITKYSFIFYSILLFGVFTVISPLIPYVFSKYILAIPIFQLMSIRLLFNSLSVSQSPLLFAYRKQKISFFIRIFVLISTLTIGPLLMLRFGIAGLVLESLISILIVVVIRELYLRKEYKLKVFDMRSLFSIDDYDKVVINGIVNTIKNKLRLSRR